jgi:hypothetical protein
MDWGQKFPRMECLYINQQLTNRTVTKRHDYYFGYFTRTSLPILQLLPKLSIVCNIVNNQVEKSIMSYGKILLCEQIFSF